MKDVIYIVIKAFNGWFSALSSENIFKKAGHNKRVLSLSNNLILGRHMMEKFVIYRSYRSVFHDLFVFIIAKKCFEEEYQTCLSF